MIYYIMLTFLGGMVGFILRGWSDDQRRDRAQKRAHQKTSSLVKRFHATPLLKWYRLEVYRPTDGASISWMVRLGAESNHFMWIMDLCNRGEIMLSTIRPYGAQSPEDWFLVQAQIASLAEEAKRRVSIPIPPCGDAELRHLLPEAFQAKAVQMMMKTGFLAEGSPAHTMMLRTTHNFGE